MTDLTRPDEATVEDQSESESDVVQEPADVDGTTNVAGDADSDEMTEQPTRARRRRDWPRLIGFIILPAVVVVLALAAAYVKWNVAALERQAEVRAESVQAAKDITVAILSYQPDTAEQKLGAARELLTGSFRDSYTQLTNDVVIPGAKQQKITATANVPAASSVSAEADHAVVLVFVNQTTTIGNGAPSDTASSVKVALDKIDGRWLVSQFDPV